MDLNDSNTLGEVYSQYGIFFHSMEEFRSEIKRIFCKRWTDLTTNDFENIAEAHYNLACGSSRLLLSEEMLDHLRQAINTNPRFRDIAMTDEDFKAVRNDVPFKTLIHNKD